MSTDTNKPVVIRLASGAEYGLKSVAEAKRVYPNAEIVRYTDGSLYVPEDEVPGGSEAAAGTALLKHSRADLDAIATELGIEDPGKLANKEAVVAAIEAAKASAEGTE